MPITVAEVAKSRPLIIDRKASETTREYWARGDLEEEEININNAVADEAPNAVLGLVKKSIDSQPQGGGWWICKVKYGILEGGVLTPEGDPPPQMDGSSLLGPDFSFTTSGGTQHITTSIQTLLKVGLNGAAPEDNKKVIGVSDEGVAGVDITVPNSELVWTKRIEFVTVDYYRTLVETTGTQNVFDWNGFKQFELLFLGAEGKFDGDGIEDFSWLVTFKFRSGTRKEDIEIAPGLVVTGKDPHDYLWVGQEQKLLAGEFRVLPRAISAYVEQVYEVSDFQDRFGF